MLRWSCFGRRFFRCVLPHFPTTGLFLYVIPTRGGGCKWGGVTTKLSAHHLANVSANSFP